MLSRIRKIFTEYREIKYLAYHDALTGLFNRNWLYKNIDSINHKYVYFIDINDLKIQNKKGHTYGDRYLQYIILKLGLNLPEEDILVRYAGDEFILFSNTFNVVQTNKQYSIGYCDLSLHTIEECINIADSTMIKAKEKFKKKFNS